MTERWAVYRIHYGTDFLRQSIRSIYDHVDHIYICISQEPWTKKKSVQYLGQDVDIPENPDNPVDLLVAEYEQDQKVGFFLQEFDTPKNQFGKIVKEVFEFVERSPSQILMMEPDMVLTPSMIDWMFDITDNSPVKSMLFEQVEVWRKVADQYYRIPQRHRHGPAIWNVNDNYEISTHFGPEGDNGRDQVRIGQGDHYCHNFGFCLNPETMLYKHLLAMAFSSEIGDSIPSETWYRDKWLNWTPETTDLEIAARWTHAIPRAEIYSMPDEIRNIMEK